MSFSRAKITRFNDLDTNTSKQLGNVNKTSGKFQKNEKSGNTRSATSKPLQKPRSLSQPSSNTIVIKQSQRPHSGGDEKVRQRDKGKKVLPSEKYIEDEKCESGDIEKSSTEQIYIIDENTDDEKICEDKNLTSDTKINTNSKISSSGIPLRIRQQQTSAQSNVTSPSKPSPRVPSKTNNKLRCIRSSENSSVKLSPACESPKTMTPAAKRNLEMQYQLKKKKMEQLKKEIVYRQKLLTESYNTLVQLNKKLDEAGKSYPLEELKANITFIAFEDPGLANERMPSPPASKDNVSDTCASNENVQKPKIDPNILQNMKDTISQIPIKLLEMCRNLMDKREAVIGILEKISLNPIEQQELQNNIQDIKEENPNLEKILEEAFNEQEKNVMDLVEKWQTLVMNSGDCTTAMEIIANLKEILQQKDNQIQQQLVAAEETRVQHEELIANSEKSIAELREKIKSLEHQLNLEKTVIQESKDKSNLYDQRMKLLKSRIKEMEGKQKDSEHKCTELQKAHRQAQDQLRANEHRWIKEKDEMLLKQKTDRQMLDKLTKDRSCFETRVKILEELMEEKDKNLKETIVEKTNQVEEARKQALQEKSQRETLQQKYNVLKDKMVEMEIRNKQALDLVHSKSNSDPNESTNEDSVITEREAELYTELLATKVALKAAEDQIQNYNREKLRFIDSIQSMQGDPDKDQEYVAKTMIKNVEKITLLESSLSESEETICNQKIEIANLKADIENLRQCSIINPIESENEDKESDLKMMLREGRTKLEHSLKKTLEHEHKIIRYEHDLNKQSKQICEMENLLKVRDGLITMMKAKKDELQMENDSLNRYANEIRDLLLQAKEEARNRTELVQELSTNLDSRGRICQQLEKKVKELEGSLSATNEKRFKLQESIGVMEKELQSTKAHFSKMGSEMQSRYESDINIQQIDHAGTKCHQHYKHHHKNRQTLTKSKRHIQQIASEGNNLEDTIHECATAEGNSEIDRWMEYYHKKLKYLRRTFRTVSNSIFMNDINLHTTAQKCAIKNNTRKYSNFPLTLPPSFTYFKPRITTSDKRKHQEHSLEDIMDNTNKEKTTTLKVSLPLITDLEISGDYNNITETYRNPDVATRKSSEELQNIINPTYEMSEECTQEQKDSERNNKLNLNTVNVTDILTPSSNNFLKRTESPCILSKLRMPFSLPVSLSTVRDKLHNSQRRNKQNVVRTGPNSTRPKRLSNTVSPVLRRKVLSGSEPSILIKKSKLKNIIKSNATCTEVNLNKVLKTEQMKFINHAHNISCHLNKKQLKPQYANTHYIPKLLTGIRQYKVMHSAGSVVLCKPSTEMEVNSVLINHDLMAHSLSKINADVTSTINLLSKKYPKSTAENQDDKTNK